MLELMVAMVAGMIVAAGTFAFAKASTRAFSQESRVANATTSVTFGFRRLVNDISRASFLSTPNIQREYQRGGSVCVNPAGAPAAIRDLAGIRVEKGATYATNGSASPNSVINGTTPDRLLLTGAYESSELFWTKTIVQNGANVDIYLQETSGAVTRLLQPGAGAVSATPVTQLFRAGRILRIVDKQGFQHFGVIQASSLDASGGANVPKITLANAPAMFVQGQVFGQAHHPNCVGLEQPGVGLQVSVISRVLYEVRDLKTNANYASLYAGSQDLGAGVTVATTNEDGSRFELVRTELDVSDAPIGDSEIVAEYAVDLRFGGTIDVRAANAGALGAAGPQLDVQSFDIGHSTFYDYTALVSTQPTNAGPERIKSVRTRLSIRSREADRKEDVPAGTTLQGYPGGIFRFRLADAPGGEARYARARTLQAEVALMNQGGVFW